VPVLVESGREPLHDSQAILVYLAARFGAGDWWPYDVFEQGKLVQWLSFSANELHNGPNLARLHFLLNVPVDLAAAQERSKEALRLLNSHLENRDWLELGRPTIADVAVFPYVSLAPEGEVILAPYPAVTSWIDRFAALPKYRPMIGL
jgi:glutathione S-transferase